MAGNAEGAKKAAITNKLRHGENFYQRIGRLGGNNGTTGGFAARIECDCDVIEGAHVKAQCRGRIGGQKSSRAKKVVQ